MQGERESGREGEREGDGGERERERERLGRGGDKERGRAGKSRKKGREGERERAREQESKRGREEERKTGRETAGLAKGLTPRRSISSSLELMGLLRKNPDPSFDRQPLLLSNYRSAFARFLRSLI